VLNKLYKFIKSSDQARNIWVLGSTTGLLLVTYNLIKLPELIARQLGYSGSQPMFAIDMQFNYSPGWVYSVLTNYGEEGRQVYGYLLVLLDFIFPLIYSLLLASGLSAILRRLLPEGSGWQKLSLLGLVPGMMDWLENLSILSLILNYPRQLWWLANLTNIFTLAKYGFVLLDILLIIGWGVVLMVRRRNLAATTINHSKIVK
jgi:hypothetical protein